MRGKGAGPLGTRMVSEHSRPQSPRSFWPVAGDRGLWAREWVSEQIEQTEAPGTKMIRQWKVHNMRKAAWPKSFPELLFWNSTGNESRPRHCQHDHSYWYIFIALMFHLHYTKLASY